MLAAVCLAVATVSALDAQADKPPKYSRLQRLEQPLLLRWQALAAQVGSDTGRTSHLAQRVKAVLPDVLAVYPDAKVEVVRHGLRLLPSKPPVPRTLIGGFRVVEGGMAQGTNLGMASRIGSRRPG